MAHLRDLELLSVFETTRKFNLLLQDLSLHADALAVRAEDLGQAPGSLTLHTSLLDVKVANDTAASTAFEALARLGARLCSSAFTCGAGNSFIKFDLDFLSFDCFCKFYRYFSLEVGTYCVISCDT